MRAEGQEKYYETTSTDNLVVHWKICCTFMQLARIIGIWKVSNPQVLLMYGQICEATSQMFKSSVFFTIERLTLTQQAFFVKALAFKYSGRALSIVKSV